MAEQNLSTPTTEDALTKALNKAVTEGNQEEIDRLMAVELPEPEATPEVKEPEVTPEIPEDKPATEPEVKEGEVTEDASSEVVEVDGDKKDEAAAGNPDAASKPAKAQVEDTDEITALKAEINRLKSDAGRVPYIQRRMQELERELRDAKLSRKPEAKAPEAKPDNEDVIPKSVQKRLAALKELDPDLAETLEELTRAIKDDVRGHTDQVVQTVTSEADSRADEVFIQEQYQALVSEVPWAPQAFQSPEWRAWKETLTPARRAFAESMYADEVKIALAAFSNDMQARAQQNGNHVPQSQPNVVTPQGGDPNTSVAGTTETSKVQEARAQRMATAPAVRGSVAAKSGSTQLDPEAQFSEFYKQIQKENHLG